MSYQCYSFLRSTLILYLVVTVLMESTTGDTQRICGRALNDLLHSMCQRFNGYNLRARRCVSEGQEPPKIDGSLYYRLKDILGKQQLDFGHKENDKTDDSTGTAEKLLIRERRETDSPNGVADECCVNGCSYDDMLLYCD